MAEAPAFACSPVPARYHDDGLIRPRPHCLLCPPLRDRRRHDPRPAPPQRGAGTFSRQRCFTGRGHASRRAPTIARNPDSGAAIRRPDWREVRYRAECRLAHRDEQAERRRPVLPSPSPMPAASFRSTPSTIRSPASMSLRTRPGSPASLRYPYWMRPGYVEELVDLGGRNDVVRAAKHASPATGAPAALLRGCQA
jgi:hypothetical protein